ncbi:gamma-glutamyltransferase [Paenibacillus humicola]|uniref:gamma-glutamyltransferase n=1 Tax=Paenibacillus humicola TaxID=3110540 RepID=UPI00237BF62B|nr:gamma-glutamyltransferase [Paenibacillus humicola]
MDFDSAYYPYSSRRYALYARNGMVATSQPFAAQAGLDMLRRGGNAIDAAIATAACLTVVEPTTNGIGGDAFALVWTKGELQGMNGSGPAPRSISIDALQKAGHTTMPVYGAVPVTVPGAPAAWAALSERFGRLPFPDVLQPAIDYAERGFPITPSLGKTWSSAYRNYLKSVTGDAFAEWFRVFAPDGRAPEIGEMWKARDHAATLRLIAETKAEAFYRGELAEKIDACMKQAGGYLTKEDLAAYKPEWVRPLSVNYRGYDVWELPPNGQGIVALMALNLLKGFEFTTRDHPDTYHKQIEAIKLAFADGMKYVTDPRNMKMPVEALLSEAYAADRRTLIGRTALLPEPGSPPRGGTVYLAAADGEGNMVSFIQSNYMGFGSGIVVPGTGIALQNRGHNFSMDPSHDNRLEPGKRPYHTIIPGFLTKDGQPIGPFGVMGAFMQPQGHVQVVMNTIDFGLNPQSALDAPRWQWTSGRTVELEHSTPEHIADALSRMEHQVQLSPASRFGRGQIIWRSPGGVLAGGTEPRTDGYVSVW